MTPDDDLIEIIETLARYVGGALVATGLGATLVARTMRRRWGR